jgi:drug/metabolite transporter (DMT)-like permease
MGIGTIGPIILMSIGSFYTTQTFDFLISPFIMPTIDLIPLILGLGITATLSQLFMTKAYSLAKSGIVGTIGYSNVIFSIFLGMMLGDAFPTITVLIGIGLIILSGYLVSKKEK